jgi:hypothetical protein
MGLVVEGMEVGAPHVSHPESGVAGSNHSQAGMDHGSSLSGIQIVTYVVPFGSPLPHYPTNTGGWGTQNGYAVNFRGLEDQLQIHFELSVLNFWGEQL